MFNPASNPFSNRSCGFEFATLVFAYLKLIFLTLGIVGGIAGIVAGNTQMFWGWRDLALRSLLVVVICGFQLVFTAFLFHGVLKKRPRYIIVYFVFGVAMLLLTNFGIVAFATFLDRPCSLLPPFPSWNPAILATVVIGQAVYALILAMVYKTYWKIKETAKIKASAKILDEQKQLLFKEILDKKMLFAV